MERYFTPEVGGGRRSAPARRPVTSRGVGAEAGSVMPRQVEQVEDPTFGLGFVGLAHITGRMVTVNLAGLERRFTEPLPPGC